MEATRNINKKINDIITVIFVLIVGRPRESFHTVKKICNTKNIKKNIKDNIFRINI